MRIDSNSVRYRSSEIARASSARFRLVMSSTDAIAKSGGSPFAHNGDMVMLTQMMPPSLRT